MDIEHSSRKHLLVGFLSITAATIYAALFLYYESEIAIGGLLMLGTIVVFAASRTGVLRSASRAFHAHPKAMHMLVIVGVLALAGIFYEDHFALFMIIRVLLFIVACLGLNIQFGYAGIVNFSGAPFLGVGCYTAAVLTMHTPIPHVLVLLLGGLMAAIIGSLLILPILRTRGHYAALITIAFAILFKTFLEVNDALGGPQGLKVDGMRLLGWVFNDNIEIGAFEGSFYLSYTLLALTLVVLAFVFTKRLERSWIGLNLDAGRLDETAAACFGLDIAKWKITGFTLGNFFIGVAGALYGMMLGFIAPNNFTFGDSLIFVSIILLGGIGNPWGLSLAATIILLLPEKLQVIQEYRFLLYSILVIAILLLRPEGLLPRPLRVYFPAWRRAK